MIKNLTGSAVISYGPTLPDAATTFDGALFYKTSLPDSGLFVFGFIQDSDPANPGDQSAQGWSIVQNSSLYVSKNGDVINGALALTGGGAAPDPYGRLSVTLPGDTNNYGYIGLTRQAQVGWTIGIDTSNRLFFGNGAGTLSNAGNRFFTFEQNGNITTNGNTVWHSGNDGAGSALDAGLLGGQGPAYYLDAQYMTGQLPVARLPYTPVRQNGTNNIALALNGSSRLTLGIDSNAVTTTWPIDINGSAATANSANSATNATNATEAVSTLYIHSGGTVGGTAMKFTWNDIGGTPAYLWGGNSIGDQRVWLTSSLAVGSATTAGSAANATDAVSTRYLRAGGAANGTQMSFTWAGQPGQPTWVWGGNDGQSMYVWDPSGFSVAYAASAPWSGITSRPTALSQFSNDSGFVTSASSSASYLSRAADVWATSSDGAQRFHFSSTGNTGYKSAANHQWYNGAGAGTMYLTPQGDLVASGNVTALSDRRVKTDITLISDALAKVSELTGVTYTRTDTYDRHTGLIAQDVQAVLPEAVHEGGDGMLSVAYGNMVGLLVESIKELNRKVESLTSELQAIKDKQ